MDEELQKQNTDCVYFLASPLTCKKGLECEYRHSEVARLNPTDCWYWLAGSCLNPSCAFRHPPLDARTELSSESAPLQPQSSAPGNKVNVPCYFYFNGFCNKGDKCSFLHGAVDDGPAWKSLKTDSAVSNAPLLENKTSAGSDAGSAPMESQPNPSEAAPYIAAKVEINPIEDAHLSALGNVKDQSNSPLIPSSECDETAAIRSDTLPLRESLMYSRSPVCSDQSSDEQVDCHVEREDWLESSPGFDVLVDDKSENLEYEVDPEYLLTIDRHGRELNGPFIGYDYKDTVEYEPAYSDVGFPYEQERPYSNGNFDEERYECMRKVPGYSRERMLNRISPRKRKFLPADLAIGGWSGVDLRDHLRNGRVINDHEVTRFSRRDSRIDRIQDRYPQHGMRRLHRRLNAEVNNYGLGSPSRNGTLLDGANQQGWFRQSGSKSRQRCKEKRQSKQQVHSSKITVKSVSRKRTCNEESVMFTGPKTLAQIKEEKRMTIGNDDFFGKMGHSSSTVSQQRQVPKT